MAEEYHVRVRLKAGPFAVDENTPSVIRAKDLRGEPSFLDRVTSLLMGWQTDAPKAAEAD